MTECTGEEILREFLSYCGLGDRYAELAPHRPITPLFPAQFVIRICVACLKKLLGKNKLSVSDLPKVNIFKLPRMLRQLVDALNAVAKMPDYYIEREENR